MVKYVDIRVVVNLINKGIQEILLALGRACAFKDEVELGQCLAGCQLALEFEIVLKAGQRIHVHGNAGL